MIKTHLCETEKQMRSMKREKISYDINRPTKAQLRKSLCQHGATETDLHRHDNAMPTRSEATL